MFQQILNHIKANYHYRHDQSGIIQRYLNEGTNWHSHLSNTKKYILHSLPNNKLNSIAILGSGWLLDVPIDELLQKTEKLVLIDIYHPKPIVNKYKNNKQVQFEKIDLTNNLIQGIVKSKTFDDFITFFEVVPPLRILNDYNWVVSLNLLNQLDILLCDLLKKKFNIGENELINLRKEIQIRHLKSLPKGKSCIITDYEEINYASLFENQEGQKLIYQSLEYLSDRQEWLWNFDTCKSYRRNLNTTFKVIAGKY